MKQIKAEEKKKEEREETAKRTIKGKKNMENIRKEAESMQEKENEIWRTWNSPQSPE